MPELFDMRLRALRRDRAARIGPELFLHERAFADCLERIGVVKRKFDRALLIGAPDPNWPAWLKSHAANVETRDPGPEFASATGGEPIIEDSWEPPQGRFDLVLALGTLDSVNGLPFALHLLRHAIQPGGFLIGAMSGGDTLPMLRAAMRVADSVTGAAAPHVHPRVEASALAPLLEQAGFVRPVVDVERLRVSYRSLDRLVADLRAMGATNLLHARPRFVPRSARAAAAEHFRAAGENGRTVETFEILHFAAWVAEQG